MEPDDSPTVVRFIFEDGGAPDQASLDAIVDALLGLGATQGQLEKAVAPHDSHLAQRTAGGKFVRFNWRRENPRGTGGRFIRRLTVEEQQEATRLAQTVRLRFATQMEHHLGDLRKGRLDAAEATDRGHAAIEEYHEQIFRLGMQAVGNPAIILSPRDRSALSRIVRDECDYWTGFMNDVADGRGTVPYDERLAMYVNASHEPFWLGWVLGDFRPKRRIRWMYGPTVEHCKDCSEMVKRGWMTIVLFLDFGLKKGLLPQSGYLSCKGIKCRCRLIEADK